MAQIWMDDENAGALVLPRSNRKMMHMPLGDNALQQSAKKTVLSKLDNVMYNSNNNNKSNITPFKGANQMWPMNCAPKLSLCKETLQKQHRKQHTKDALHLIDGQLKTPTTADKAAVNDLYARSADAKDNFDLFDYMDFPSAKCLNNCHKSITQNGWLEPVLSDELIEKLLNHSGDLEDEVVYNNNNNNEDYNYEEFDTLAPLEYHNNKADILDMPSAMPPLPIAFDEEFDLF